MFSVFRMTQHGITGGSKLTLNAFRPFGALSSFAREGGKHLELCFLCCYSIQICTIMNKFNVYSYNKTEVLILSNNGYLHIAPPHINSSKCVLLLFLRPRQFCRAMLHSIPWFVKKPGSKPRTCCPVEPGWVYSCERYPLLSRVVSLACRSARLFGLISSPHSFYLQSYFLFKCFWTGQVWCFQAYPLSLLRSVLEQLRTVGIRNSWSDPRVVTRDRCTCSIRHKTPAVSLSGGRELRPDCYWMCRDACWQSKPPTSRFWTQPRDICC